MIINVCVRAPLAVDTLLLRLNSLDLVVHCVYGFSGSLLIIVIVMYRTLAKISSPFSARTLGAGRIIAAVSFHSNNDTMHSRLQINRGLHL